MLHAAKLSAFLTGLELNGFVIGLPERQRTFDLLMSLMAGGMMPDNSEQLCNMLGAVLCRSAQQQIQFRREFAHHFGAWKGRQPSIENDGAPTEPRIAIGTPAEPAGGPPTGRPHAYRQVVVRAVVILVLLAGLSAVLPELMLEIVPPVDLPSPSTLNFQAFRSWLLSTLEGPRAVIEGMQTTFGPATLLLVYVVFIAAALWVAAPSRPFYAYMSRRRLDYRPQLVELLVKPAEFNPFLDRNFARRVQDLRRPRLVDSHELDVSASLSATIDHGGLFSPVFSCRRVAPEYLVLIDRRSVNDHVAQYADALVEALRQMRLYVDRYTYNSDFRRLHAGGNAPSITIEEVIGRCPEHRLVVIGSGERLFDPSSGRLYRWAALVKNFQRRIMLTPIPRELWDYRERTLQEGLETAVVELGREAISAMAEFLAKDEPPRPGTPAPETGVYAPAMVQLADLLDDRPSRWVEDAVPEDASLSAFHQDLRRALPAPDYDWLAACAVYPEMNWKLTTHLGLALPATPLTQGAAATGRLLHIFGLPWFRSGRMPSWLRRLLVDRMSEAAYRRVHRTLEALLLTTLSTVPRKSIMEAALESPPTMSDREALSSLVRNMRDSVLIDFMTRLRKDRTVVRLPHAMMRFLRRDGILRNIFSREPEDEAAAAAQVVRNEVEASLLEVFEVEPVDAKAEVGPELRRLARAFNRLGTQTSAFDGYFIYLPVGSKPVRLLDSASATLYRRRRDLAWRLSTLNLVVVLVIALILYGGLFTSEKANAFVNLNLGIASIIALLLIVAPFAVLNALLVRPILQRFSLFPAGRPAEDAPSFAATRFRIEQADPGGLFSQRRPELEI